MNDKIKSNKLPEKTLRYINKKKNLIGILKISIC